MDLYVIGGQQKYLRPLLADDATWYEYHKGIIIRLNVESKKAETVIEYISPVDRRAEAHGATLFKSGSVRDGTLYVCTQSEVVMYLVPQFAEIGSISLPWFNDVHHVTPTPSGDVAVAVAGLDMILLIDRNGKVLQKVNVLGPESSRKFSWEVDYRKMSTKPHQSHPNFIFFLEDEMWATRFCQKDAISLRDPKRRIEIGIASPHDGLVHGDFIYFSTVNGNVVVANKKTLQIEQVINLNDLHDYTGPLGWCRGLMVEDEKLWVGFSRIRPTKLRENVEWVKRNLKAKLGPMLPSTNSQTHNKLRGELPTHLACYDLRNRKCLLEINVEDHGVSAIFSIFSGATMSARISEDLLKSPTVLEQAHFPST